MLIYINDIQNSPKVKNNEAMVDFCLGVMKTLGNTVTEAEHNVRCIINSGK